MKAIALAAAVGLMSGMAVTKPGMVGWAKHKVASMMCGGKAKSCSPEQQAQMKAKCEQMKAQRAAAQAACCKK